MEIENVKYSVPFCLGYARVSTVEQRDNGLSLDVQKTKILERVQELGGELVEDIYMDGGISGSSMSNRPALHEMLARSSKKDISYLVVQDTSRVARNTLEYLTIKSELKKYNTRIITLTGVVGLDDGNPMEETSDEMMAVFNALHSRMTSYKVKQTAKEKLKSGIWPAMATLGYQNIVNPNPTGSYDKRIVVQDEKTAPFITQAFMKYATGDHSIYSITQFLTKNGVEGRLGKKLHYSAVYKILTNPFCYGLMRWKGSEIMGKHQPLITKPIFDIVQNILAGKGQYAIRKRKHNFLLNGFVFCKNCGRRFVAEWHYNPKFKSRGGKIGYYHCSGLGKRGTGCKEKYVLLEDLEGQVEQEIEKLQFKPEFVEAVKKNISQVYSNTTERVQASKKAINNRKVAIELKRDKLEEELLAGTFDRDTYKRLITKIDSDLLDIQTELLEIDKVRTVDMKIIEEVMAITQDIAKAYKEADIYLKKAYLHFFFKEFLIKDKKIAEIKFQPIIEVLQRANSVILSTSWLLG